MAEISQIEPRSIATKACKADFVTPKAVEKIRQAFAREGVAAVCVWVFWAEVARA